MPCTRSLPEAYYRVAAAAKLAKTYPPASQSRARARCNDMHVTVNEKRFSGNGNGEHGDRRREPGLAGRGENLTKLQPAAAAENPTRLLSSSLSMTS